MYLFYDNDDVAKQSINALIGYQTGNLFHLLKIHNKSHNCLFKSQKEKKNVEKEKLLPHLKYRKENNIILIPDEKIL